MEHNRGELVSAIEFADRSTEKDIMAEGDSTHTTPELPSFSFGSQKPGGIRSEDMSREGFGRGY
jgi:hypothetical protein